MFDLHAYVAEEMRGDAMRLLESTDGVRHATALPASSARTVHVMAEVDARAAEEVLESLQTLGIPSVRLVWRGAIGSSPPERR